MSRNRFPLSLTATLMAGTAMADVPQVAVDIAPVHSLVARVMDGVGEPSLIVQPGGSPHEYSLRPSEAAALQDADIVVWVGEDLTPWMAGAVGTLAAEADVTTLLEVDGVTLLDFREGALFEAHSHDDGDHDHEEHAEGEAHDHDHEEHAEATLMTTTMKSTPKRTHTIMTTITTMPMARMIRTPGSRPKTRRSGWM
jgi:zinc transport system substrate-binding protein